MLLELQIVTELVAVEADTSAEFAYVVWFRDIEVVFPTVVTEVVKGYKKRKVDNGETKAVGFNTRGSELTTGDPRLVSGVSDDRQVVGCDGLVHLLDEIVIPVSGFLNGGLVGC